MAGPVPVPRRKGPFERTLGLVVALAEWLAVALLVAMTVIVTLAVFYRYVLGDSLVWYDEVASFVLVWLTFVGAIVVTARRRHIGFELLVERSSPPVRRALEVVGELCILAFQVILVVYGWNLVVRMGDETAVSLLWLQMGWIYAVMPASGAIMALISLRRLALLLRGAPVAAGGAHAPLDVTE